MWGICLPKQIGSVANIPARMLAGMTNGVLKTYLTQRLPKVIFTARITASQVFYKDRLLLIQLKTELWETAKPNCEVDVITYKEANH